MYSQIEKTTFQMQQNMVLKQIDTNYCRFWQLQALACLYAHNKNDETLFYPMPASKVGKHSFQPLVILIMTIILSFQIYA